MAEKENKIKTMLLEARQYLELNIEYAKLTAAEKTAVLMTTVATVTVCALMGLIVLFFLSIAAVHWLAMVMSLALAYTIMAAFNLLLLALVLVFRRQLLVNPISRFVSRLLLK